MSLNHGSISVTCTVLVAPYHILVRAGGSSISNDECDQVSKRIEGASSLSSSYRLSCAFDALTVLTVVRVVDVFNLRSTSSSSSAFTAFIPTVGMLYFAVLIIFSCMAGMVLLRTAADAFGCTKPRR